MVKGLESAKALDESVDTNIIKANAQALRRRPKRELYNDGSDSASRVVTHMCSFLLILIRINSAKLPSPEADIEDLLPVHLYIDAFNIAYSKELIFSKQIRVRTDIGRGSHDALPLGSALRASG